MRVSHMITAIAALALALALCSPALGAQSAELSDTDVAAAIRRELRDAPGVAAPHVTVSVSEGVALLTGEVSSLLAKRRAEKVAESVRGVVSVVDRVSVEVPVSRSEGEIAADVVEAVKAEPALDIADIRIAVSGAEVRLSGTVRSWQELRLAEMVAAGVLGVTEVKNDIAVEYGRNRSDLEVEADVKKRLFWDVRVSHERIDVRVEDGVVVLSGRVASLAEKRRTYGDAFVAGTASVNAEDLKVDPSLAGEPTKPAGRTLPDEEIRRAIRLAFEADPRVISLQPNISVRDGLVTLTGVVSSLRSKRAAGEAAYNTLGVWKVENELFVRRDAEKDHRLTNRVRYALARSSEVDATDVLVSVVDGKAFLSGRVNTLSERRAAKETAESVEGITALEDNLEVGASVTTLKSDAELAADIRDELFWDPYVDSDDVTVSVQDGRAELTGMVQTRLQRDLAGEAAVEAGAGEVVNNLEIR